MNLEDDLRIHFQPKVRFSENDRYFLNGMKICKKLNYIEDAENNCLI